MAGAADMPSLENHATGARRLGQQDGRQRGKGAGASEPSLEQAIMGLSDAGPGAYQVS